MDNCDGMGVVIMVCSSLEMEGVTFDICGRRDCDSNSCVACGDAGEVGMIELERMYDGGSGFTSWCMDGMVSLWMTVVDEVDS